MTIYLHVAPSSGRHTWNVCGIGFHLPGVYALRRVGLQILVLRLPQFLHAPTQHSKVLEKSTNSFNH